MIRRSAFTLIEVLISVALLSLVLMGLYESLDLQRSSNRHLQEFLRQAMERDRVATVLYRDLLASNGDLTLVNDTFDRLCINRTTHSLYALPEAKVCWVVTKGDNTLTRIEGNSYKLPLRQEDRVAIDKVLPGMTLFDLYRKKGDLLVAFQAAGQEPYTFLVQGLEAPPKPSKAKKAPKIKRRPRPPTGNQKNK
jgi:prepilin-type N-terminal cleavage/methylation domain-containing protein